MFDKEKYEKILSVTCSREELTEFTRDLDKAELDTDGAFKKYYSVDRIIAAIDRYLGGEIDANYLSHWATAYNWIIMSDFTDDGGQSVSLEFFIIWDISDILDSLSFFDGDEGYWNMDSYKRRFKVLDVLLRDIDRCSAVLSFATEERIDETVLVSDEAVKGFTVIYGDADLSDDKIDIPVVPISKLKNKMRYLKKCGYVKM